jgi:hypothetical protein
MFAIRQFATRLSASSATRSIMHLEIPKMFSTEKTKPNFVKSFVTVLDKESTFTAIPIQYKCSLMETKHKVVIGKPSINQAVNIYKELENNQIKQIDYFHLGNKKMKTIHSPDTCSISEFMIDAGQGQVKEFIYTKHKTPMYSKYHPDELFSMTYGIIDDAIKEIVSTMTLSDVVHKKHLFADKIVAHTKSKCKKYGIKIDLVVGRG